MGNFKKKSSIFSIFLVNVELKTILRQISAEDGPASMNGITFFPLHHVVTMQMWTYETQKGDLLFLQVQCERFKRPAEGSESCGSFIEEDPPIGL